MLPCVEGLQKKQVPDHASKWLSSLGATPNCIGGCQESRRTFSLGRSQVPLDHVSSGQVALYSHAAGTPIALVVQQRPNRWC